MSKIKSAICTFFFLVFLASLAIDIFLAKVLKETEFSKSNTYLESISKIELEYPIIYSPIDQLKIKKSNENLQFLKLFFYNSFFQIQTKEKQKEHYIVYFTRVQYFLDDLDILILSSRHHPPTTSFKTT